MLVIRADLHKMFDRIANREDPDQDCFRSGSVLFVLGHFGRLLVFEL